MEIRRIKDEEIYYMVKLMRKLFDKWHKTDKNDKLDLEYFYSKKHIRDLKKWSKKSNLIVAIENNKIVGFIDAEIKKRPNLYKIKEEGHINLLYVEPAFRKKGTGKLLIEEVLKIFKEKKLRFITVNTHAFDKEANEFWRKRGFRKYNISYVKED